MQRSWKLKLLSGALPGVEYVLCEGDALFCIGSRKDLLNGVVGETIGRAENTYYIPDDHDALVFVVRIRCDEAGDDATPVVSIGERDDASGAWSFRDISFNEIQQIGNLHFALRAEDESWSSQVNDFVPPPASMLVASQVHPGVAPKRLRRLGICAAVLLVLFAGGMSVYQWLSPGARVNDITGLLRTAPYEFSVSYGRDGTVYVLADDAQGAAWAQRAAERRGLTHGYRFIDEAAERERIGDLVLRQGADYTVIRLDDVRRPAVVLAGETALSEPSRDRLRNALKESMPYAEDVRMLFVPDARLREMASEGLSAAGVPARFYRDAEVWVATNDAYVSDAQINGMRQFAASFAREWGTRRLAIRIRLWDDLLKGRSYQYGTDQLLSVGDGRWEFSTRSENSAKNR